MIITQYCDSIQINKSLTFYMRTNDISFVSKKMTYRLCQDLPDTAEVVAKAQQFILIICSCFVNGIIYD